MENPSDRGLSLTLSWHAGPKKHALSLRVGTLLYALGAGALCAVSFQFGFWKASLERQADVVVAQAKELAPLAASALNAERGEGAAAAGHAMKEPEPDIITPLNVRDPSALVMGPGAEEQVPPKYAEAPTPPPPPRKRASKRN